MRETDREMRLFLKAFFTSTTSFTNKQKQYSYGSGLCVLGKLSLNSLSQHTLQSLRAKRLSVCLSWDDAVVMDAPLDQRAT